MMYFNTNINSSEIGVTTMTLKMVLRVLRGCIHLLVEPKRVSKIKGRKCFCKVVPVTNLI